MTLSMTFPQRPKHGQRLDYQERELRLYCKRLFSSLWSSRSRWRQGQHTEGHGHCRDVNMPGRER